jgi:hypothetical protein
MPAGVYQRVGRAMTNEATTEAERLKRDIEDKLDAIRLTWVETSRSISPVERAEIRWSIELHLADLKQLIAS